MLIRDRIRELRRVPARELRPHPRNWRTHSDRQRDALRGMLAEVGYADALLARELPDGSLELIDGHLRAETTPELLVPVLVLDVDEGEAAKLLATLDPLANLAGSNRDVLAEVLAETTTDNAALQTLWDELLAATALELPPAAALPNVENLPPPVEVPELYQLIVDCADEAEQQALYEELSERGLKIRVVSL
jgi:ParB-like chromosome segregation protein Spo0J